MLESIRYILLLIILLVSFNLFPQTKSYRITLAPFSTPTNDEFSPVYYKTGIVFCSNLKNNSLVTYHNKQKKLFNIFFADKQDNTNWKNVKILAKELTTNYNDGPVTFNEKDNIIYYCRNNNIKEHIRDISDTSNKLGIYSAKFINGEWTNISSFSYNNPLYSFVSPSLTYDGKRLYFASDMPGGYGGFDLYYCNWSDNGWVRPVNLGPAINTSKNESFPFACKSGYLFFASDGHKGFGGKDLYYSREMNETWIKPIHLDAEINSPYDDFGLVTDENFENGFFSSNRRKTDDIYYFTVNPIQFSNCDSMVKNNYCFLFYDEYQKENDSIPVIYEWDFGNGIKKLGLKVKHCFPGPGKYEVKLNIIDSLINDSIFGKTSYQFELKEINQVYINSPDAGIVNDTMSFDGLKTNLPDFEISDYLWNFGDGFIIRGPVTNKVFNKKGDYIVQLGLLGEKDSLGDNSQACVYKKIKIFDDYQELASQTAKETSDLEEFYSFKRTKDLESDSCSSVISKKRNDVTKELDFLMIKIYLLNNLSELQKDIIFEKFHDMKGCTIKMNNSGIDSISFPILSEFIKVLKENPEIRLEIAVHTGNKGFSGNNLELSEKWASSIDSFFSNNGITSKTLHCKGYGESRQSIAKSSEGEMDLSGRIEFIFINNTN